MNYILAQNVSKIGFRFVLYVSGLSKASLNSSPYQIPKPYFIRSVGYFQSIFSLFQVDRNDSGNLAYSIYDSLSLDRPYLFILKLMQILTIVQVYLATFDTLDNLLFLLRNTINFFANIKYFGTNVFDSRAIVESLIEDFWCI